MSIEKGYLDTVDDGYLEGPYLGGEYQDLFGFQVNMVIADKEKILGQQAQMVIVDSAALGQQALMVVVNPDTYGMQVSAQSFAETTKGMQVTTVIADQVSFGMEVIADTLRHAMCEGYLTEEYMEESYLAECMNAFMGMQALMSHKDQLHETGMQALQVIQDQKYIGQQVLMIVNSEQAQGQQANMIRIERIGAQATMVIYNVTHLRLMHDFPSRGTAALGGTNWTASSQAVGEYYPYNVNTDIVEQIYRSATGTAALTTLTCDTGITQGVPIDTIAILGHNFTKSALVQVQGSNDNFATAPNISFNMTTELENMYYISPTFPTAAGQNRYWRFIIQDSTNPDEYVEVGTILFGTADIFSTRECFENPVVTGFRHFKDELRTEGFTNVSNDRALKKFLRLKFSKLNFFKGNYRLIDENIKYTRTSLKTLVIPTPEYPSRFAVFAKLTRMPEITHQDIDEDTGYIDLDLEWDESL